MSQVIIKNVEIDNVSKGKNSWQVANITYSANGETKHAKIMSFGDSATAFANLKDMKDGDTAELTWEKNAAGYVTLMGASKVEGAAKTATTTAPRSNYETPDERAYKQVLIVRQSCLAQAVAYTNYLGQGAEITVPNLLDIGQQFVDWVMQADEAQEGS